MPTTLTATLWILTACAPLDPSYCKPVAGYTSPEECATRAVMLAESRAGKRPPPPQVVIRCVRRDAI